MFGIFDLAFSNLVDPSIFIRESFVVASRVAVAVPSEFPMSPQTVSVRMRRCVVCRRASVLQVEVDTTRWCAQATAAGSVRSGRAGV